MSRENVATLVGVAGIDFVRENIVILPRDGRSRGSKGHRKA